MSVRLVKDINGGSNATPYNLIAVGSTLFFLADDGVRTELWESDGTEAGTTLVTDSSPILDLIAVGSTLFFVTNGGVHGWQLWRSDGTAAGTLLVKVFSSPVADLIAVGSTLFFVTNGGVYGWQLWRSDGTAAGTLLVKDINLGGGYAYRHDFTALGNTLFFSADDGVHGHELWRSDGTAAGTLMVKDTHPAGWSVGSVTAVGTRLFFFATFFYSNGGVLWTSDGTEAGTPDGQGHDQKPLELRRLRNPTLHLPSDLTAVGNTLFFLTNDDIPGFELWKSDGTEAGTLMVRASTPPISQRWEARCSSWPTTACMARNCGRAMAAPPIRRWSKTSTLHSGPTPLQQSHSDGKHAVLRGRRRRAWYGTVEVGRHCGWHHPRQRYQPQR